MKLGCFHSVSREASATFLDSSSLICSSSFDIVFFPFVWLEWGPAVSGYAALRQ